MARSGGQRRVFTVPARGAFAITASPTAGSTGCAPSMAPSCHAPPASARSRVGGSPDSTIAGLVPSRYTRITRGCRAEEASMPDVFEYVSQARLEYRHGYRHAYLGDVPAPVVYGVQGRLREYYGVKEGPPVASTLDHIVAAVAG